jgi:citrate synthase
MRTDFLSAQEAAEALGISKSTLYAYVSRGLIRSEPDDGPSRARRYLAVDVHGLVERKAQRHNPARAAAQALDFGAPVLESAVTLIEDGHLYYRGRDACQLARTARFEDVAARLWLEDGDADALFATAGNAPAVDWPELQALTPLDRLQALLPAVAQADLAAYNRTPRAVAATGVRLLRLMARCLLGDADEEPLAAQLAAAWAPDEPAARPLIDVALILCADHELNISAFTARCIASAGSPPYLAVNGAICALRGHRHGGSTELVAALFDDAATDPHQALAVRLRRGESLPGFGHRLYPGGDPRAELLLDRLRAELGAVPAGRLADSICRLAADATGLQPNIDLALVALSRALGLPPDAPLSLFALGRTAGWIGQIIEQYQQDALIRPRARYVGQRPE